MPLSKELVRASTAIKNAKALIITAGSGMGVNSGLPDFRGTQGLWRAYPPLKKFNLELASMSTPRFFVQDPHLAWGFFGHRFNMYRAKTPHHGFQILLNWAKSMPHGYFVFTSNVDGHFQKAGYEESRICECHGSMEYFQLVDISKGASIWPASKDLVFEVDEDTLKLKSQIPMGPPENPLFLARPNILMFSDWDWVQERTKHQENRYFNYQLQLRESSDPYVVIEIGSGLAVPTVRTASEDLVGPTSNSVLIRINPNEPSVPDPSTNIAIKMEALEALKTIDQMLNM
jgi:NAD-dependent SIR2 family protein deacetylase